MQSGENVRIDKFLWAVRIFKSRSLAAMACKKGRIEVNNTPAKPSRTVSVNDNITVRRPPSTFTYVVKNLTENRIPAKNVHLFIDDLTPEEEKTRFTAVRSSRIAVRPRGSGRPTKKERRELDDFFESAGM